jgi:hypothetical protein
MRLLSLTTALILTIQLSASEPTLIQQERSTFLYGSKAEIAEGDFDRHKGRYLPWKGNAKLVWEVSAPQEGEYELYFTASVSEKGKDRNLYLKTGGKEFTLNLLPTSGPYPGGRNFERVRLPFNLSLQKGAQQITLSSRDIQSEDMMLDFRSLELVPVAAKDKIAAEYDKALDSRASVDWMMEAGYGLMFHWTSQSVQPDGSIKPYEEAVNEFDVERFAGLVEETGAGFVFLTIGHAESYCPAPIKSWEKCHPGMTTERDLIMEISDALSMKDIRFLCYINGPLGFKLDVNGDRPEEKEKREFVKNFNNILSEMGNRYKDKVAGYWFDSWYQIFEEYPEVPFEDFHSASKTGNKDRIICLNSWIYPPVTPWQEYWAGEVGGRMGLPVNGYMENGPVTDLPYQALLIMEPYWVQKEAKMPPPRFTSDKLAGYIKDCIKNKGAVTINLGIYQDGTVGEEALQVMREVRKKIRR